MNVKIPNMARISPEKIKELQVILKEQTGKDYTDQETQEAGLAIMRFVIAKRNRDLDRDEMDGM